MPAETHERRIVAEEVEELKGARLVTPARSTVEIHLIGRGRHAFQRV
jgi:hypothetical protein